ncbi:MAG TPA: YbhB/YbcL family Raf kinase inhibitor-like protein [Burkholderiales bacterium]|nr:YbhB/YbcL family Raf kinase inhibitor-like protein [Burkholderiales bacterium]
MKRFALWLTMMMPVTALAGGAAFTLESPDIPHNSRIKDAQVFNGFGCTGQNVSPALTWKNAPAGTKSFALLMYDPDAPTGSGWWHWLVYNLPASTTSLAAGAGKADGSALPAGALQGNTDFGTPGYGGPCPPVGHGIHHYQFTLYALKVDKLDVPATATAAYIGYMANANALAKAKFTGLYSR